MDLTPPVAGGDVHAAYANPRPEVTPLIPAAARAVLDLGCSSGVMGATLRARGQHVVGLEVDPQLAALARTRLETVIEADVEALAAAGTDPGGPFDCVVAADVLEHLRDPWLVVRWARTLLSPRGSLVVSVPNVCHLRTFWALAVRRRWPFEDVGIFDRSHLRFFARHNLEELLAETDLRIVELRRSHLLSLDYSSRWNRLAPHLGDLGTLQFVFRAEPAHPGPSPAHPGSNPAPAGPRPAPAGPNPAPAGGP